MRAPNKNKNSKRPLAGRWRSWSRGASGRSLTAPNTLQTLLGGRRKVSGPWDEAGKAHSPHGPENSEDKEGKKELCVLHAEPLELSERGDGVLQRPALTTVALQALQQFVGLHKRFPQDRSERLRLLD